MLIRPTIAGVILAGGLSRRMGGGDKALRMLEGQSILERVIDRVGPQVRMLALNANGDPSRFSETGLDIVSDPVEDYPGPLAGVLAGLEWARERVPECSHVASFPCDAPFLPEDLVDRLWRAMDEDGADLSCARSAGRDHPVIGLWPVSIAEALRAALIDEGIRKVDRWTGRYRLAIAEFTDLPVDPFFNVNSPEDLAKAELLMGLA